MKIINRTVKARGLGFLLFLVSAALCFAAGRAETVSPSRYAAPEFHAPDMTAETAPDAPLFPQAPPSPDIAVRAEQVTPSRAELVMKALAEAYPQQIGDAAFKNGDWAVELRGKWYYYAEGRILPEELLGRAGSYSSQPFYAYPEDLPEWQPPSPENAARYAAMATQRRSGSGVSRAQIFYDDLWRVHNRAEAWEQQKTIRFLGREALVHRAILEELALVEQRINEAAAADPRVRQWVSRLQTISAWNWRDIADTRSRSNHAYGIAVDLLPAPQNRLETYWLWTAQKNVDWWNVPYSKRLNPPDAVIKAFEAYGFIWGGKWLFYDTMHFEYRPEILFLNGLPPKGEY
jgi:hypothetical protein